MPNFKKTIDKSGEEVYNNIVNSKGAASEELVVPSFLYHYKMV